MSGYHVGCKMRDLRCAHTPAQPIFAGDWHLFRGAFADSRVRRSNTAADHMRKRCLSPSRPWSLTPSPQRCQWLSAFRKEAKHPKRRARRVLRWLR